jgi:hypothetical protein
MAGLAVLVGLEWCKVKVPPAFLGTQGKTSLEEDWGQRWQKERQHGQRRAFQRRRLIFWENCTPYPLARRWAITISTIIIAFNSGETVLKSDIQVD